MYAYPQTLVMILLKYVYHHIILINYNWNSYILKYCILSMYVRMVFGLIYSIHDTVLCIGTVCMHTPNTDIIQYTWHSTMYRYCMYAYPKHWYYTVYMTQYYVSVLYVCIPQTLILFKYTPSREDLEQTIWRGELRAQRAHSGQGVWGLWQFLILCNP